MSKNDSMNRIMEFIRGIAIPTKKVAALLVVVLFFCPMFFVSCQAPLVGEIKVNISGMDVATGFTVTSDGDKTNALMAKISGNDIPTDSMIEGNPVTFLLLGIAVAMLVSAFLIKKVAARKLNTAQAGLAVVHIVGWIIFMSQVRAYVQSEVGSTVEVKTTFFYILNLLAGVAFGIAALADVMEKKPISGAANALDSEPMEKPIERVVPEKSVIKRKAAPRKVDPEPTKPIEESAVRINVSSNRYEEKKDTPVETEAKKESDAGGHFHRPTGL